jgi:NAD(P)-dependent dehydrogenase (short-subunit alcohol dehydrogenase family)
VTERKRRRSRRPRSDIALLRRTSTGSPSRPPDVPLEGYRGLGPHGIGEAKKPLRCYACHKAYHVVDRFYHALCPKCADHNRVMRGASVPLAGMHAVVTGGRVKIGYEVALKLLRDGATVSVTTRFPRDAARRFSEAHDSKAWWSRLAIIGADFRSPAEVLACADVIASRGTVDILINNAAQTIRRPETAYVLLEKGERHAVTSQLEGAIARHGRLSLEQSSGSFGTAALPRAGGSADPTDALEGLAELPELRAVNASGLLLDTLPQNSWSKRLGEVDVIEMLEVQLCNVVAPFVLISSLIAQSSDRAARYVVNVSATEGQFSRRYKSASHPHTNMAKAALNMLTRTSAAELAKHGVYMTSVDTGWVTDERPFPLQQAMTKAGFQPPLDVVDGAARIYHPIVVGERGDPIWGILLKHYRKVRW